MPFRGKLLAAVVTLGFCLTAQGAEDRTILILRHGEKPGEGLGQLSCRGLNRAFALPPLIFARYGRPAAIYAPNPSVLKMDNGRNYAYIRPLVTIEPLAVRSSLPVDIQFGMTQVNQLASTLLAQAGKLHVVAWEHHWGEALARSLLRLLGANPDIVPAWADDDFDSIYVIHIIASDSGAPERVTFVHDHENLDGLPDICMEWSAKAIRESTLSPQCREP